MVRHAIACLTIHNHMFPEKIVRFARIVRTNAAPARQIHHLAGEVVEK